MFFYSLSDGNKIIAKQYGDDYKMIPNLKSTQIWKWKVEEEDWQ